MLRFISVLGLTIATGLPFPVLAQDRGQPDNPSGTIEDVIGRPFLEVDYGFASPQFKGADFDFESIGMLEFKLGYALNDSVEASVVSLMESYLLFTVANADLGSSGSAGDVGSEFKRFGLGNRLGFGYQGDSIGFDLYNLNSLNWTKFEAADYENSPPEAQAVFDRYGSTHRFGTLMEAGVKLRIQRTVALTAGMEGAIVYPRYVFWPWLGSTLIYSGLQGVMETFADNAMEASPSFGPVLYFLLKTGVSLGYYLAVRDDMNWPFDSETPVTVETFKIGGSFTF